MFGVFTFAEEPFASLSTEAFVPIPKPQVVAGGGISSSSSTIKGRNLHEELLKKFGDDEEPIQIQVESVDEPVLIDAAVYQARVLPTNIDISALEAILASYDQTRSAAERQMLEIAIREARIRQDDEDIEELIALGVL